MPISLAPRALSYETLTSILNLAVSDEQQAYVAPNAYTVAQNTFEKGGWVRGLWDGETPVGLIAMIDPAIESPSAEPDDPKDCAYLWRLMIDKNQQGKGYGKLAMDIAFEQARAWGYAKFLTSCVPGPHTPQPFYESVGLRPTGRLVDGEVELAGKTPPAPKQA